MNFLISPILHPFLQTLTSLILCLGILNVGRLINKAFFKNYDYYFFDLSIASIFLSQIIYLFFSFGFFKQIIFVLSYLLIFLGIVNIKIYKKIKISLKSLFKQKFNITKILILITLFCFFIISIGPPSMVDALDYHYGVTLFLLNNSELPNQDIWLHGSLFGNGELFNAIGLYLKSDNFFTIFQLLSLILFLEFLINKEKDNFKLIFIILFIISSPVIIFLISGPKPLLFPQLLTTAALYILIKEKKLNAECVLLIGILLLGAMQFKLSFILSCTILGLFTLMRSYKDNKKILLYLVVLSFFFISPKILYNLSQINDFQLINIFTTLPTPFLENLSQFRDNEFMYPLNLFITNSYGGITTMLGFQLLLLLFIKKISKEFFKILTITFFTIFLHFIFSQQTSRIYFEFLLWISIGFCFLKRKYFNYKLFAFLLIPQFFVVTIISFYFSIMSSLTLISLDYRDQFMKKNSFEYEGIKWSNVQIPSEVVIISELRSNAFFNNQVIPLENKLNLQKTKKYIEYLKEKKPKFIISYKNNFDGHFLEKCIGKLYKTSENLKKGARNSFNRNKMYKIYIYYFSSEKLNYCVNLG